LWAWKRAIIDRLARLRLTIHERPAQVLPVENGIPWLGFVVFPSHRRVKARKVRDAANRLSGRVDDYLAGHITFAELDASVKGWVNHIRYADTWGLRRHVFARLRFTRVPEKFPGATRPWAPRSGAAEKQ
jgi:RNA-directed DNA polymerase